MYVQREASKENRLRNKRPFQTEQLGSSKYKDPVHPDLKHPPKYNCQRFTQKQLVVNILMKIHILDLPLLSLTEIHLHFWDDIDGIDKQSVASIDININGKRLALSKIGGNFQNRLISIFSSLLVTVRF